MVSVQTGSDAPATRRRPKGYALDYQFPVLDFLLLRTLLPGEMNSAQVLKYLNDFNVSATMPAVGTIRARLDRLAHEGFLTYRQEANSRRLYFSITDNGKMRLHEICSLARSLGEVAHSAKVELAVYLWERRRTR